MGTSPHALAEAALADRVRAAVRDVPDFPRPGILFKDITPILTDGPLLRDVIRHLASLYQAAALDAIAAIEARGFIFGAAVAAELGIGFIPVRKPGKLPYRSVRAEYALEYGTDCVEVHEDAIRPGQRILVLDDVLATGGTAAATLDLIRQLHGEVAGTAFLIELAFLNGRDRLPDIEVFSLVSY